jgi:hypothetical protein
LVEVARTKLNVKYNDPWPTQQSQAYLNQIDWQGI